MSGTREHVSGFSHEVHAAENDVAAVGSSGKLRKLVGVASEIGEPDDFIALIVMAQDNHVASKLLSGGMDTFVHGVIRQDEVIVE